MASINDRWYNKSKSGEKEKTDRFGTGKRWQVRWRDLEGRSKNKSFETKADAEKFAASTKVQLDRGTYQDPNLLKVSLSELADRWFSLRTVSEQTKTQNEIHLRKFIKPYFGNRPIRQIKASDIQGFISYLSEQSISPRYVRLVFSTLQSIYEFALKDDLVPRNLAIPRHYQFPSLPEGRVSVWSKEEFLSILNQLSGIPRLIALIGATCGLRQGELFGLRVQDLDFEKSEITVRQQISPHKYRPTPTLTKNRKTRTVPVPEQVMNELKKHVDSIEPLEGERLLSPCVGGLIFFLRERLPINKNYFVTAFWHPAIKAAGLPRSRENGMHGLRHFCASTWLTNGVNIKAVSNYLGHSDPGFTLRIYTHLMISGDDQAKSSFEFINIS